jgi:hypothetical protein
MNTTTWNRNQTFRLVRDTAETWALQNTRNGQFEHGGFGTKEWARKFFHTTFGGSDTNSLETGYGRVERGGR